MKQASADKGWNTATPEELSAFSGVAGRSGDHQQSKEGMTDGRKMNRSADDIHLIAAPVRVDCTRMRK
jgi:hypothetical protein